MGYKIDGIRVLASVLQEVFNDKGGSLNIVPFINKRTFKTNNCKPL